MWVDGGNRTCQRRNVVIRRPVEVNGIGTRQHHLLTKFNERVARQLPWWNNGNIGNIHHLYKLSLGGGPAASRRLFVEWVGVGNDQLHIPAVFVRQVITYHRVGLVRGARITSLKGPGVGLWATGHSIG